MRTDRQTDRQTELISNHPTHSSATAVVGIHNNSVQSNLAKGRIVFPGSSEWTRPLRALAVGGRCTVTAADQCKNLPGCTLPAHHTVPINQSINQSKLFVTRAMSCRSSNLRRGAVPWVYPYCTMGRHMPIPSQNCPFLWKEFWTPSEPCQCPHNSTPES